MLMMANRRRSMMRKRSTLGVSMVSAWYTKRRGR